MFLSELVEGANFASPSSFFPESSRFSARSFLTSSPRVVESSPTKEVVESSPTKEVVEFVIELLFPSSLVGSPCSELLENANSNKFK